MTHECWYAIKQRNEGSDAFVLVRQPIKLKKTLWTENSDNPVKN